MAEHHLGKDSDKEAGNCLRVQAQPFYLCSIIYLQETREVGYLKPANGPVTTSEHQIVSFTQQRVVYGALSVLVVLSLIDHLSAAEAKG